VQQGAAYADAKKMGAVLGYGQFLTILVNFLIVAAVLFIIIQAMNRLIKKEQPAPKPQPSGIKLVTEIRDLLAAKKLTNRERVQRPLAGRGNRQSPLHGERSP
jgi:large conductance mechanosensitive channel